MANKAAIIHSDLDIRQKITGLVVCIAQKKKAEITRLITPFGISMLQLNILHALSYAPEGQLTVNEIKQLMFDESPNVSRSLNKLVDAGYVVKQRSEKDQRIVHIHITEIGRQTHIDADKALLSTTADMDLPEAELEQLYSLLVKL